MAGILPDNLAELLPLGPGRPKRPKRKYRRAPGVTGGILGDDDGSPGGPDLARCLPPWLRLPPGSFIEISAPPVKRGRRKKLTPQQRVDVGSFIISRQWDIAVAKAKERDDASAQARWFRKYRKDKNGPPPQLPRTIFVEHGHRFKKLPKVIRANLALRAKTAYSLARAGDWYLMQGGYNAYAQPLAGLQFRFRSEPIKRPRGADKSQHREARAYCKAKFGVTISADTARECMREFEAFERVLTGKRRQFSPLPAARKPGKPGRPNHWDKKSRALHTKQASRNQAAQWIADFYGRDRDD